MTRKRHIPTALLIVGLLAMGGFVWWQFDPFEPRFEGVPDSALALAAADPNSGQLINLKEEQLRRMGGRRAAQALVRAYSRSQPGWEEKFPKIANTRLFGPLHRFSWMTDLHETAWKESWRRRQMRNRIIQLLGKCGPSAAPEIPLIVSHWYGDGRPYASEALIGIGQPAVPTIHACMSQERDVGMLRSMLAGLKRISPMEELKAAARLETLMLTDPDERVRAHCAEMLAGLGPRARDSATALRQAQKDSWRMVREAADRALQAIGVTNSPTDPLR
jgi:hypothetical protein